MPKVWNRRDSNCPKDAVYVGRPSKWGNPYKIFGQETRKKVIEEFRGYALTRLNLEPHWLDELKGKDLVCFCTPLPCHADILMELANKLGGEYECI
jgi:hypothetical protein